jgi:hypothetical protein
MAQTRAIGKAYRNTFGFIAKAAGFEATPAEEMPRETPMPGTPPGTPKIGEGRLTSEQRARVVKAVQASGKDLRLVLSSVGAETVESLTTAHAIKIRERLDADDEGAK